MTGPEVVKESVGVGHQSEMEGEAREECRVAPGLLCWQAGLEERVLCHAGPRGVWETAVGAPRKPPCAVGSRSMQLRTKMGLENTGLGAISS